VQHALRKAGRAEVARAAAAAEARPPQVPGAGLAGRLGRAAAAVRAAWAARRRRGAVLHARAGARAGLRRWVRGHALRMPMPQLRAPLQVLRACGRLPPLGSAPCCSVLHPESDVGSRRLSHGWLQGAGDTCAAQEPVAPHTASKLQFWAQPVPAVAANGQAALDV